MVVFFTEEDLASFGTFMVSDLRKMYVIEALTKEGLTKEEITAKLKIVNDIDFQYWDSLTYGPQKHVSDEGSSN